MLTVYKLLLLQMRTFNAADSAVEGGPKVYAIPHLTESDQYAKELETVHKLYQSNRDDSSEGFQNDMVNATKRLLWMTWTGKWMRSEDNCVPDPTIRLIILSQLRSDGRWRRAEVCTPLLAKLKYMIVSKLFLSVRETRCHWSYYLRLFFLSFQRLFMLLMVHEFAKVREEPLDKSSIYLSKYTLEKEETSFSNVCSIMHTATNVVLNTARLPNIDWIDRKHFREFLYNGDLI